MRDTIGVLAFRTVSQYLPHHTSSSLFLLAYSASYRPNIYADMSNKLPLLYERDNFLVVLLDNTVYLTQMLNLGPQTIITLHFDAKHKFNYYIIITAFRPFNP